MAKSEELEVGSSEWIKDWMAKRKAKRISQATSLKELGDYLKDLGYKYIRVYYEGSGDSGESFEAEGWKGEIDLSRDDDGTKWPENYQSQAWNHDKEENFDKWKDMTRNQKELEEQYRLFKEHHPDINLQSDLHYELVEMIDYDWYNNEGGQGELVWHLKTGKFVCNGEQNHSSCVDVKETYFIDGSEPETEYGDKVHER